MDDPKNKPICERCERVLTEIDLMHSKTTCQECIQKILFELYSESNYHKPKVKP